MSTAISPPAGGDIVSKFPPAPPASGGALIYWDPTLKQYVDVSVGSGLSVSGGVITASGSGGSPGGTSGQMQYNNAGAFGGSPLVYAPFGSGEPAWTVAYQDGTVIAIGGGINDNMSNNGVIEVGDSVAQFLGTLFTIDAANGFFNFNLGNLQIVSGYFIVDSGNVPFIDTNNRILYDDTNINQLQINESGVNVNSLLVASGIQLGNSGLNADGSASFASNGFTITTSGVIKAAGYQSSDGSTGDSTTVTTSSLVGKTMTFKNGLLTSFS